MSQSPEGARSADARPPVKPAAKKAVPTAAPVAPPASTPAAAPTVAEQKVTIDQCLEAFGAFLDAPSDNAEVAQLQEEVRQHRQDILDSDEDAFMAAVDELIAKAPATVPALADLKSKKEAFVAAQLAQAKAREAQEAVKTAERMKGQLSRLVESSESLQKALVELRKIENPVELVKQTRDQVDLTKKLAELAPLQQQMETLSAELERRQQALEVLEAAGSADPKVGVLKAEDPKTPGSIKEVEAKIDALTASEEYTQLTIDIPEQLEEITGSLTFERRGQAAKLPRLLHAAYMAATALYDLRSELRRGNGANKTINERLKNEAADFSGAKLLQQLSPIPAAVNGSEADRQVVDAYLQVLTGDKAHQFVTKCDAIAAALKKVQTAAAKAPAAPAASTDVTAQLASAKQALQTARDAYVATLPQEDGDLVPRATQRQTTSERFAAFMQGVEGEVGGFTTRISESAEQTWSQAIVTRLKRIVQYQLLKAVLVQLKTTNNPNASRTEVQALVDELAKNKAERLGFTTGETVDPAILAHLEDALGEIRRGVEQTMREELGENAGGQLVTRVQINLHPKGKRVLASLGTARGNQQEMQSEVGNYRETLESLQAQLIGKAEECLASYEADVAELDQLREEHGRKKTERDDTLGTSGNEFLDFGGDDDWDADDLDELEDEWASMSTAKKELQLGLGKKRHELTLEELEAQIALKEDEIATKHEGLGVLDELHLKVVSAEASVARMDDQLMGWEHVFREGTKGTFKAFEALKVSHVDGNRNYVVHPAAAPAGPREAKAIVATMRARQILTVSA